MTPLRHQLEQALAFENKKWIANAHSLFPEQDDLGTGMRAAFVAGAAEHIIKIQPLLKLMLDVVSAADEWKRTTADRHREKWPNDCMLAWDKLDVALVRLEKELEE